MEGTGQTQTNGRGHGRERGGRRTKTERHSPSTTTPESSPDQVNMKNDKGSDDVRPPSVADFDRDTVRELESKNVSELNIDDLLKILIVRGEDQKNPVVSGGCERLLKQINRERVGRGRGRGRGGRFRRQEEFNQRRRYRGRFGRKFNNEESSDNSSHDQDPTTNQ